MILELPIELAFNALVFVFFLGFWLVSFVILYHLTRFGIGVQPKRLAAVFFLGAIILFCASILLYANLDLANLIPK